MEAKEECYRIVLSRIAQPQQAGVAAQLANIFNIARETAAQIVRSAPTVLLRGLSRAQAMELAAALAAVREAGAELRIASGEDPSLPHVSWPAPPRIAGKAVTAEPSAREDEISFACPCCGAKLRIVITAKPTAVEKNSPPASSPPSVSSQPETSTAVAKAVDGEEEDPLFEDVPPLVETGPFRPLLTLQEFETGMQEAVAAQRAAADPKGIKRKNESPSPTGPAPVIAEDNSPGRRDQGTFNVIISGGAGNPKALALVKDVLRVPEKDAALLLQNPSLSVAQGVSREVAVKLAARFKAANVNVRITQRVVS